MRLTLPAVHADNPRTLALANDSGGVMLVGGGTMSPPGSSLADIVAAKPGATRVFERHRIDYWCGGHRSLAEAARDANTPLETLEADLAQVPTDERGRQPSTEAALIEQLVTHHQRPLLEQVARLGHLAGRLALPGELRALAVRDWLTCYTRGLTHHIACSRALFADLLARETTPWGAMERLRRSGQSLTELDADLRHLTSEFVPPDDATSDQVDLWRDLEAMLMAVHVLLHLERNVLLAQVATRDGGGDRNPDDP